jgi:hypothetical protein
MSQTPTRQMPHLFAAATNFRAPCRRRDPIFSLEHHLSLVDAIAASWQVTQWLILCCHSSLSWTGKAGSLSEVFFCPHRFGDC